MERPVASGWSHGPPRRLRAVVFEGCTQFPVLKEVERPTPGPGEVLLKVAGSDQADKIRELTGGRVDAVLDFVGVAPTIELAAKVVAQQGSLTVVGIGGGSFGWNFFTVPYEVNFSSTYWGTIEDLHDVVAMYRAGQIVPVVERFSLDEALEAYRKLQDGELSTRAVVVPHGQ